MLRKCSFYALLAACLAASAIVYTASAQTQTPPPPPGPMPMPMPMAGEQAAKTVSGTVVDLGTYLMHRTAGEDPTKAMEAAGKPPMAAGTGGGGGGGGGEAMGRMRMNPALVSTQGAMGGAAEVYVLLPDPGNMSAMMSARRMMGQSVTVTGKEYNQDGVRAMTVQKMEGPGGAAAPMGGPGPGGAAAPPPPPPAGPPPMPGPAR